MAGVGRCVGGRIGRMIVGRLGGDAEQVRRHEALLLELLLEDHLHLGHARAQVLLWRGKRIESN